MAEILIEKSFGDFFLEPVRSSSFVTVTFHRSTFCYILVYLVPVVKCGIPLQDIMNNSNIYQKIYFMYIVFVTKAVPETFENLKMLTHI